MLAESIASNINWSLISTILMAIATVGMWLDARKGRPLQISPQPLPVEVVKALHEQFADREEFKKHVAHNTDRHNQLFKSIDRVEIATREKMEQRFDALAVDRQKTMEKLGDEFVYIRESLASINTELKLNRESKNPKS